MFVNFINKISKDSYIRKNFNKFNAYFLLNKLSYQNNSIISERTKLS